CVRHAYSLLHVPPGRPNHRWTASEPDDIGRTLVGYADCSAMAGCPVSDVGLDRRFAHCGNGISAGAQQEIGNLTIFFFSKLHLQGYLALTICPLQPTWPIPH